MKELLVETLWERAPQTKGRTRNVLDMFKDLQGVFWAKERHSLIYLMTVDDSKYCVANRLCGDKGTIPRRVLQLYNVVGGGWGEGDDGKDQNGSSDGKGVAQVSEIGCFEVQSKRFINELGVVCEVGKKLCCLHGFKTVQREGYSSYLQIWWQMKEKPWKGGTWSWAGTCSIWDAPQT